ncbi:MAG TPA: sugar phosphate isomerase/epimerase family protein [Candidatus Acidoferrum sp.]
MTERISRRKFAKTLGAVTSGVAACATLGERLAWARTAAVDPEPHVNFPRDPRQRLAVAAWPFRAYIDSPTNSDRDRNKPGMDLKDFGAYVVKTFNVSGVEPYNLHFSSTTPEYLSRFRDSFSKAGAHAVNIAVDQEQSFYDADRPTRQAAVAYAKKWIDVAVAIGSPSVRTNIAPAKNTAPNLANAVESMKEVASYGASRNVVVHMENDNLVSEDAFFVVKIIEGVNNPYLHALPDFANSMMSGNADFAYRAITAMFVHAYGICHVKDGDFAQNGKDYPIDLDKTFGILKANEYRGYCSIEYSGAGDPHEPTKKLIEESVGYLG